MKRSSPLKRTPFKRKPQKAKATSGKPKRPKRPIPMHHHKPTRDAYKAENPRDEWDEHLFIPERGQYPILSQMFPNEVNHIFTNPKRDKWPILITLSKLNHDWFHANIQAGRILCLLVKCLKGEADLELWNLAYGKNVAALPILAAAGLDGWMRPYSDRLQVELQKLEQRKSAA